MGIRELVRTRAAEMQTREVCGETVKIRLLSVGEVLRIGNLPADKRAAELATVALHDEAGAPLFASPADASACPWEMFQPLVKAVNEANGLSVAEAEKK